eukprot:GILI01053345.1.p2 GENE.GILI01053345.1~~GILI01053345.1.p2  ORF type:complete len:114 (-),score=13.46 GILI01053345.1:100-441(-)
MTLFSGEQNGDAKSIGREHEGGDGRQRFIHIKRIGNGHRSKRKEEYVGKNATQTAPNTLASDNQIGDDMCAEKCKGEEEEEWRRTRRDFFKRIAPKDERAAQKRDDEEALKRS